MILQTKQDKGVAGLTILLSVIVMLFVIGLLVMLFSLMSSELRDNDILYERTGSLSIAGETITPTDLGDSLAVADYRSVSCSITVVTNATASGSVIASGNYTEVSECVVGNLTSVWPDDWVINYTYNYLADEHGTAGVINDTGNGIANVTDWFPIFLVISAMVVLILLTVIIITTIRSSGMINGANGKNSVGTA